MTVYIHYIRALCSFSQIERLLLAGLIFCGIILAARAGETVDKSGNPAFRPAALWLDNHNVPINAHGGGVLFMPGTMPDQGTYYWFGEHKVAGDLGNTAQVGIHVYSSSDLASWKDQGIALKVADRPDMDICRGSIIERPKVVYNSRTKKFVMWFHLELVGKGYASARCGVAVASSATGPYRYIGSFRPDVGAWPMNTSLATHHPVGPEDRPELDEIKTDGGPYPGYPTNIIYRRDFAVGQMARDMTLFVDDDETAYVIYASEENGTLHISQLTPDYLKTAGRYVRVLPGGFNEAPALFKSAGKYFLFSSHCTGWSPNAGRLSVADSIWGPWREVGNPWHGPQDKISVSYGTQSTFVLPVADHPGAFIYMADLWRPQNAIDGRYVWLPIRWQDGLPELAWRDQWGLSEFDYTATGKATGKVTQLEKLAQIQDKP